MQGNRDLFLRKGLWSRCKPTSSLYGGGWGEHTWDETEMGSGFVPPSVSQGTGCWIQGWARGEVPPSELGWTETPSFVRQEGGLMLTVNNGVHVANFGAHFYLEEGYFELRTEA